MSENHNWVDIEKLPGYLEREGFREKLSDGLLEYYEKVVEFMEENGRPPSIKEVNPPDSVEKEIVDEG